MQDTTAPTSSRQPSNDLCHLGHLGYLGHLGHRTARALPLSTLLLALSLGLGCDALDDDMTIERSAQLDDEGPSALTAEQILSEVDEIGVVEGELDARSDSELPELMAASDELIELRSEAELERFLAYSQGELGFVNSVPIGVHSTHWS